MTITVGEVGTVLASSQAMPMPVIWLLGSPVPAKGIQPCAPREQTLSQVPRCPHCSGATGCEGGVVPGGGNQLCVGTHTHLNPLS
jgi:hypothetical protein